MTAQCGSPVARFRVKVAEDGRAYLNLGCGTRMHATWNNVDFSLYARLRRHAILWGGLRVAGLLSPERYARLMAIDPDIIVWDLRRGVPFPDLTFDVVYHSHLLEHLDRQDAAAFLRECLRVLRVGGTLRVVVPDLEVRIRHYTRAVRTWRSGNTSRAERAHEQAVADLFEQMVRTDGAGGLRQRPLVRFLERRVRGDAGAIGERHRWMYDQYSLSRLLEEVGFAEMCVRAPADSAIPGWSTFALDTDPDCSPYHRDSLYVEAIRPSRDAPPSTLRPVVSVPP